MCQKNDYDFRPQWLTHTPAKIGMTCTPVSHCSITEQTRGWRVQATTLDINLRLVIHRPPHPCRCDVPKQLSHSTYCAVIYVLPLTNPYLTTTLQHIGSIQMKDIHFQCAHKMHVWNHMFHGLHWAITIIFIFHAMYSMTWTNESYWSCSSVKILLITNTKDICNPS